MGRSEEGGCDCIGSRAVFVRVKPEYHPLRKAMQESSYFGVIFNCVILELRIARCGIRRFTVLHHQTHGPTKRTILSKFFKQK